MNDEGDTHRQAQFRYLLMNINYTVASFNHLRESLSRTHLNWLDMRKDNGLLRAVDNQRGAMRSLENNE